MGDPLTSSQGISIEAMDELVAQTPFLQEAYDFLAKELPLRLTERVIPIMKTWLQETEKLKKPKRKKLFKLAAMDELVKRNSFLQSKYDVMSANAEDRLGYHWNEVIQNVLFNRYVKVNPDILKIYMQLRQQQEHIDAAKKVERKLKRLRKKGLAPPKEATPPKKETPEPPSSTPLPNPSPMPVDPNAPIDTRIVAENTTMSNTTNPSSENTIFGENGLFVKKSIPTRTRKLIAEAMASHGIKVPLEEPVTPIQEMESGATGAAGGSYEQPAAWSNVSPKAWLSKWRGQIAGKKVGPEGTQAIADDRTSSLANHVAVRSLTESWLEGISEGVDSTTKAAQKQSAADSKEHVKEVKSQNLPTEGKEDEEVHAKREGEKADGLIGHPATEDEIEFVELPRLAAGLDMGTVGRQFPLDAATKARWSKEAGKDKMDAALIVADKIAKRDENLPMGVIPVRMVKENMTARAWYRDETGERQFTSFAPKESTLLKEAPSGCVALYTAGMANDLTNDPASGAILESHSFFVNLQEKEVYRIPNTTPNVLQEGQLNEFRRLANYQPNTWTDHRPVR